MPALFPASIGDALHLLRRFLLRQSLIRQRRGIVDRRLGTLLGVDHGSQANFQEGASRLPALDVWLWVRGRQDFLNRRPVLRQVLDPLLNRGRVNR